MKVYRNSNGSLAVHGENCQFESTQWPRWQFVDPYTGREILNVGAADTEEGWLDAAVTADANSWGYSTHRRYCDYDIWDPKTRSIVTSSSCDNPISVVNPYNHLGYLLPGYGENDFVLPELNQDLCELPSEELWDKVGAYNHRALHNWWNVLPNITGTKEEYYSNPRRRSVPVTENNASPEPLFYVPSFYSEIKSTNLFGEMDFGSHPWVSSSPKLTLEMIEDAAKRCAQPSEFIIPQHVLDAYVRNCVLIRENMENTRECLGVPVIVTTGSPTKSEREGWVEVPIELKLDLNINSIKLDGFKVDEAMAKAKSDAAMRNVILTNVTEPDETPVLGEINLDNLDCMNCGRQLSEVLDAWYGDDENPLQDYCSICRRLPEVQKLGDEYEAKDSDE